MVPCVSLRPHPVWIFEPGAHRGIRGGEIGVRSEYFPYWNTSGLRTSTIIVLLRKGAYGDIVILKAHTQPAMPRSRFICTSLYSKTPLPLVPSTHVPRESLGSAVPGSINGWPKG